MNACISSFIMLYWLQNHMLPCALKSIFGIDCPICGFQRSFFLLFKGHFIESFLAYPPLIFGMVLILYALGAACFPHYLKRKYLPLFSYVVLMIIAVNYVVKIATGNLY